MSDLAKIIGKMWENLDADNKNRYENEYNKNKEIWKANE